MEMLFLECKTFFVSRNAMWRKTNIKYITLQYLKYFSALVNNANMGYIRFWGIENWFYSVKSINLKIDQAFIFKFRFRFYILEQFFNYKNIMHTWPFSLEVFCKWRLNLYLQDDLILSSMLCLPKRQGNMKQNEM